MPIRSHYALTPSQREHLKLLLALGAVERAHAVSVYDRGMAAFNPNVAGILIDKGWALKRTRRPAGGAQRVLYWLTPDGAAKAQDLTAEGCA